MVKRVSGLQKEDYELFHAKIPLQELTWSTELWVCIYSVNLSQFGPTLIVLVKFMK